MGTVYARGKWLWLGFVGPDGKWYYRSAKLPVGQETAARQKLAELEAAITARTPTAPAPLTYTVASWAERWGQLRVEKGKWTNAKLDLKALAQHVASAELELHGQRVHLGRLRLEEVRVVHVRAWLEAMEAKKLSANTVLSVYSLLNRMFKAAVREELLEASPCQLERGELPRLAESDPDGRPEDALFSLRELEQLISDLRVPLDRRVAYALSCLGGLRQGEVSALTWADYDATLEPLGRLYVSKSYTRRNKRVKSTKSGVARWVPAHPVTAALLAEWSLSGWEELFGRRPGPEDLLVPNRDLKHLTDLNLWGNLQHDLKVLGLRPRRFHDTRATFATYAIAGGGTWELIKHITHGVKRRSRKMSDVYVRPPWEVLCAQVQCIKAQLRGGAEVIPLQATGTGGAGLLQTATTIGGAVKPTMPHETEKTAMPRARFELSLKSPSDAAPRDGSGTSASASGAEGRRNASDCSSATTILPFRGGMLIDDGEA